MGTSRARAHGKDASFPKERLSEQEERLVATKTFYATLSPKQRKLFDQAFTFKPRDRLEPLPLDWRFIWSSKDTWRGGDEVALNRPKSATLLPLPEGDR